MQVEVWRQIPEHPDYEVSDLGRVRRITSRTSGKAGHILKAVERAKGKGYTCVTLRVNGKWRNMAVHRLVGSVFLGLAPGQIPNHKNAIRSDNRVDNLEVGTQADNIQHSYRTGRQSAEQNRGEKNGQAKLTEDIIRDIRFGTDRSRGYQARLAKKHNIHPAYVSQIVSGRFWKHVKI